jgi:hypothetical protein
MFIPLNSLNKKKRFDLLVYNYQDQIKVLSSDVYDWFSRLISSRGCKYICTNFMHNSNDDISSPALFISASIRTVNTFAVLALVLMLLLQF